MKKIWMVLLALLLAAGLVMMGCGDGDEKDDPPPPPETFDLVLGDNFEYGEGYQGLIDATRYITGKINEGDEFTLEIEFTTSRDLEDDIEIGLVDRDSSRDWWYALSWNDDEDIEMKQILLADINGKTVSKTFTITALDSALNNSFTSNSIVFQTKGQGNQGTANSGVEGPVTLKFTKFTFSRVGEEPNPGNGGGTETELTVGSEGTGGFHIRDDELALVQAALEVPGSYLKFFINVPEDAGAGNGWGVVSIGGWNPESHSTGINAPNPLTKPTDFTAEVLLTDIAVDDAIPVDSNGLIINPSNGVVITKIVLFVP